MIDNLDLLKEELKRRITRIKFHPHFYYQIKKRPYLSEAMVKTILSDFNNYLGFQIQKVNGESRYRIGVALSRKYTFVIVLEVAEEHLNIITVWKTNRKWQKSMQK